MKFKVGDHVVPKAHPEWPPILIFEVHKKGYLGSMIGLPSGVSNHHRISFDMADNWELEKSFANREKAKKALGL